MSESTSTDSTKPPSRWIPTRASALRIALTYAVVAGLWILCSGWLLHRLVHNDGLEALLENLKGWCFVAVTASLLWLALDRYFREIRNSAQRLLESEQRSRYALEGAEHGAWDWNVQTGEVVYSARWKTMLGFEPHEISNTLAEWETRVHPDDLPRVLAEVRRHLDGHAPVYMSEHRMRCRDGTYKWVLDQGKVMARTPEGRPLRVLGTHSDITAHKQAAEALQRSEERLRLALDAARMGTFDWDVASNRLTWSRQHEQLWGLAPGQFDGSYASFARGVHPEDREAVRAELERCMAARSPFQREFRVVWPDGSVHWIASAGEFSSGADGKPTRMHGVTREVTEHKRAEQRQSLSAEVLRILNDPQPLREAARLILAAVKEAIGLDAVGIRLRQGGDFPYLGADGFSQGFLESENTLAVRDAGDEFCRHEQGGIRLECTCGLVLSGRTDPTNPLFTPGGSAWTNDARPFLKVPADQDPRLAPRNRCIHEGFQSVALIPIRVKNDVVGLLQLNDRRKHCFTLEMVQFFEGIAAAVGVALQRQQEAEALRSSEGNLRSLFDAIPESVFLMDLDGTILAANGAFAARMGRRVEECVGANVFELLPPEVKERRQAWVAEVVRSGRPLVVEDQRGSYWLRHSLNPVVNASGKMERIVSFAVDLTERRREDAVRRQWADAFEHCAHGIALGDPATQRVLVCNPALARLLGRLPEEVSGSPILSMYAPADHGRVRAYLAEADRVGQVRYEVHMVREDGSLIPVQMDVVSVRDAGGKPIYRVATAQDITERRRAEEAARQQCELQDQLAKIATSVPGMVFSFRLRADGSTCMPFCTPRIEELFGLRPEEVRDDFSPAFARVHPEDVPRAQASIAASARSLQPWHDVFRVQHPHKGTLWLEGHSMPRLEPDGSVLWHGFVREVTERMQAEEALRESEARYRLVAANASDVIWLYDLAEDHFTYVSPSVERLRGFTVEEVLAQKMEAALTPEAYGVVRDQLPARLAAFAAGDESVRVQSHEVWQTCKHRPAIPTEVVTTLITDDHGRVTHIQGITRDITERKRAEAALQASEEQYRQIVENTYDIIYSLSPAGELQYVSPAWTRMLGYEMAEADGLSFTQFVHPDDHAACFAFLQEGVAEQQSQEGVEYRVRRKDGTWRWHVSNVSPRRNAAGAVTHFDGIARDITERKQAEDEIRRQTGLINALLDSVPDLIFFKDFNGGYLGCNPAFASFVGHPREEILGKTDHELFAREVAESFRQYDQQMLRELAPRHNEEWVEYPGGRKVLLDTLKTPYWGPDGRLLGVLGISRDITARHRAEEVLREREQQLQIFVEHSPAAVAMLDRDLRYMVVSRRWRADYQLGDQPVVGRTHYEVFPEIPERWKAIHRRCLAGAVESCDADPFPRADGSVDWVRWEIRPWFLGGGEIGGIIIFSELISAQVKARAALERSELEFRAMFEMASIGMGQTDPAAGRWLRVNQKLCEITGYSAGEMVGLEVQQVTHPEDRPEDEAYVRRLLGGEVPSYQREKRYVRKDGRVVWVRVNVTLIRETDGRPLRTMATIEDITERRRADERAAWDRQRTEFLLEFHQRAPQMDDRELYDHVIQRAVQLTGSQVGFFHQVSADQNTIILTTWNQEALKSCTAAFDTHYPLREAGNWADCVRQRRPVIYNNYAHSPNQRGLPAGHAPVRRFMSIPIMRDGLVRIIFGVGNKATDYEPEDVEQLQVVANELHKIMMQRAAQHQLRQLSRTVEQSPVSVVITSLAGTIEYVNPKFSEVSGYAAEEVIGQNPRVLKSGETPPGQYQQLWAAILAGREWHGEFHNRRKNGELYWELASVSPITDERDNITHFVAVKEDITERKRLEAFRQALLILGRLLNGTREPAEAGRALLQTADQLWHWDAATLDLLTPDQQTVLPVLRVDQIGGERRELPEALPSFAPTPRMRQVMQDGARLIDPSAGDSGPVVALPFGDVSRPSATIMYVPIRREHDTVGLLSIHSYTPRAYTAEDLYTLQALADYCGGALDRIRSEQGLRTSEERYRSLVETTFDWVWEVDAEGRYTYASPKVEELLGYRPEEVLGKTPFDLMPPEEAERIGTIFREYAAARRLIVGIENVCRHKNGSLVVLETSGAPVLGPDGELKGYRGMDRDVTQRRTAEAALKASEERFRTLVESAPIGVFVQADGRFVYLNEGACRIFGLAARELLLGQPVLERFRPESHAQVRERIRLLNEERLRVAPIQHQCLRMDGAVFEGEFTGVPFVYDGRPGALVFFQDVTDRNRLEAQLRQAQKLEAIGQLAGGVAHDFNNILSAILMQLGMLAQDVTLAEGQREDLAELVKEAKRGAALTRQLLMFSRRQVMQPTVLDLNALLDNLLKMLRRLLGEHVELGFRASPGPVWIEADPGMMEQVVMNLCVNARDAMADGGHVSLQTSVGKLDEAEAQRRVGARPGRFVCLRVQDTGHGMDQATLQRIFEPFFTTKEVGKGTGLGLATVHGIVMQHKGWVEVDSEVGKGTTFRVCLPAASTAGVSAALVAAQASLPRGTETLLLVEDERLLRTSMAAFLRQRGYTVIEAKDGADALERWSTRSGEIALLLSDMMMPGGLTGLELARRMRVQKPSLRVIIASGYSLDLQSHREKAGTGIVYLPKPCETDVLAKTVRKVLDRGSAA